LAQFRIDPAGRRFLDAGASTGGFTDCLLQRGAAEVIAVDVGHGQLDARLRADRRVRVLERTHVRDLTLDLIGGPVDGLVVDLSFISLRTVVAGLLALCHPGAPVLLLVKPQFEVGRQEAARTRGVIRDPRLWRRAVQEVNDAARAGGASIMGVMVSPLRGHEGNTEFFLHGVAGRGPGDPDATGLSGAALDAVVVAASA
jgi:23S rRNA (cytidine1920-2'-O)/16S rRNA (cytidine1409-2'-O)-methyltransferase